MTNEELITHIKKLFEEQVQVLKVQPGDVLVISVPQKLDEASKQRLKENVSALLPNKPKIAVLENGVKVAALLHVGDDDTSYEMVYSKR